MLLFSVLVVGIGHTQETPESNKALDEFTSLGNRFKTLKYTEDQYWHYYFERMDLLDQIKGHDSIKLSYYFHTGFSMRSLGLSRESIKAYKLFHDHYNRVKTNLTASEQKYFNSKLSSTYGYMADVYAKASYLDSAKIMHQRNIAHTQTTPDVTYASALNNYGLFFYWEMKELDSALMYFNKAYNITNTYFPDHPLLGSIRDNIADIYVEQYRIAEANALYKQNFKLYKTLYTILYSGIDVPRLISAGRQSIATDIALDNLQSAKTELGELQHIVNDTAMRLKDFPKAKLEYLQAKEMVLAATNKNHEAYTTSKMVKHLSDSITNVETQLKSNRERTINDLNLERYRKQYQLEKQQKESKIRNQELKLWIISITSLFFILLLSSLYLRRRQLNVIAKNKQLIAEQDLQLTTLRNEQLNSELKSKQRDLSDFAINLAQNQDWANVMAAKLEQLKTTRGRERKKLLDEFEQNIHNKIQFDNDTKEFYERVDKLSDTFYSVLHSKFPKLSKTEIRLCSLIRLKIDGHAIANLQNITLSSLNTARYRLRKKLNLTEEDHLDAFIQSL